jgi:formiminotetrahydrofolate cyclodeaminase
MSIYDMTLNEYLATAASKSPTPGGGSVSAVVATNAAAMISMVANLTLGKKGYENAQDQVNDILNGATKAIADLKSLTVRDMEAFDIFMSALRMPKETDEQKKARAEAMERAAQNASTVPYEICKVCLEVLKLSARLAPIGNKGAISDVGVGAYLADAAMRACMLSVDINLPSIQTTSFKNHLVTERARLFAEGEDLKLLALADVKKRL